MLDNDNLVWPNSSATSVVLKEIMEELGYEAIHKGRSCFESRNSFVYVKPDTELTKEVAEQAEEDFNKALAMQEERKCVNFDKLYSEQSDDFNKVYSVVETGGAHGFKEKINYDNYDVVASVKIANTADRRQGKDHTYLELVIDKEKMKNDKRQMVALLVPNVLLGSVIGKGGGNIKNLGQRYGKLFNVLDKDKVVAIRKQIDEYVKSEEAKNSGKSFSTIELGKYISETYKNSKEAKFVQRSVLLEANKRKEMKKGKFAVKAFHHESR